MCLTVKSLAPNVAKEDIVCYKILYRLFDGKYYTPYRLNVFPVKDGGLEGSEQCVDTRESITISRTDKYILNGGFIYSFSSKIMADTNFNSLTGLSDGCMKETRKQVLMFECVIPSGSVYYEDECGSGTYASDRLRYVRELQRKGDAVKEENNGMLLSSMVICEITSDDNYYSNQIRLLDKVIRKYGMDAYRNIKNISERGSTDKMYHVMSDGLRYGTEEFASLLLLPFILSGLKDWEGEKLYSRYDDVTVLIDGMKGFVGSLTWDDIKSATPWASYDRLISCYKSPMDAVNVLRVNCTGNMDNVSLLRYAESGVLSPLSVLLSEWVLKLINSK